MSDATNDNVKKEDEIPTIRGYQRIKKVKIELEPGIFRSFTLKEMFGGDRQEWQKEHRARYGVDYQGRPAGITDFKGLEASLISRCLYDENDKKVPKEIIQGWPSSTQAGLFELCMSLNAISDKDLEKLKVE